MGEMRFRDCYLYRGGVQTKGLVDLCTFINHKYSEKNMKLFKVADIGAYAGESAQIMKDVFGPSTQIISVDNWDIANFKNTGREGLEEELKNAELNFIKRTQGKKGYLKIKGDITDPFVLSKFPEMYFDFVYVDTTEDETDYKIHLELMKNKVKTHGFMGGSNYEKFKEIVDEFIHGEPDVITIDGSWAKTNLF